LSEILVIIALIFGFFIHKKESCKALSYIIKNAPKPWGFTGFGAG
jgi:hypothetical protein